MGESGESVEALIEKDSSESRESEGDVFDYYGMEETKGRPARKVTPDKKDKQRVRVRS